MILLLIITCQSRTKYLLFLTLCKLVFCLANAIPIFSVVPSMHEALKEYIDETVDILHPHCDTSSTCTLFYDESSSP